MGSTIIGQDFPYDIIHRGAGDEHRHNKRVDEAAKKQLKDIISQQDIITSDGNKKVKIKLKYLDQYRFTHSKDRIDNIGRDEFDDLQDGEIIQRPSPEDEGIVAKPGNEVGDEVYEAEYTIDELTEMMAEELCLPDLDETKKNEIVSDVIEWTDRRKHHGVHALLDKKKTILANILRRAKLKIQERLPIIEDDLRFRTWNTNIERHSNAVVFLMIDRSGSMYEDKIYTVKALYFWIVRFLKKKYDRVEIRFIAHDAVAKELTEKEFFTISDSGGTMVSSAYKMCRDLIKHNYPSDMWNIYCFHASDGDSWNDETECMKLVREILTDLGGNLFAYTEIRLDESQFDSNTTELWSAFRKEMKKTKNILTFQIVEMSDILPALKRFLQHTVVDTTATVSA